VSELECLAYGVGHADEGVCLLLRLGPYRILLDCGLRDLSPLLDRSLPPVDLVLCTHAHADHAQGLLELHEAFPQLPIYASEVTTQLLPLNWAAEALDQFQICQALPWRTPIELLEGLSAELYPAGHLPGAAAVLFTYAPSPSTSPFTVFYTGDFFLSNSRLVEGLPLEELRGLSPDVLIVEGSYGTARHPHRRQQENQLAERIQQAIGAQRSILLPTASLGLAQELLMLLRSHHHFTGQNIDIWVDEAIAAGCDTYLEILPHLPTAVQNFARHQPLFWDQRVRPRVRRLEPDRRGVLSPCIVLARQDTSLSQYYHADPDSWLILLAQEPHSLPRSIPEPPAPVCETYLLSQHCDGPGTTQLIHNLRPQHVVLVHGSPNYLADLAGLEELHNRYHLHVPSAGSLVELPIGETFLQPAAPETSYEGELTELNAIVTITLPDTVTADPRWPMLADTGLVEVRWQGDELVLRGVPQRELLQPSGDRLLDWVDANSPLRSCCGNCRHFRGQRCWNSASPLFELKVTPEGFCPVFESA
jgi:Cft2 family RNA processing exonuclease